MLSQERQSTRSPTSSTRTDSVRTGPVTGLLGRMSHQTSITEEDDRSTIPPAPPLPPINRQITKKSSESSSSSSSSRSTPTEPTSKPYTGGKNETKPATITNFQRSTLRHISPTEQNNQTQRTANKTTTPSEKKRGITGIYGQFSSHDDENEKSPTTFRSLSRGGKGNQSIFEKVDTHGGHSTYLGTGTFPQLEDCIRNCLARNQSHTDISHHTTKHDYPLKSLTRASVLEDYSYDGIISPNNHVLHSSSSHHHHHDIDHHKKAAAELSLTEIREVNDVLAKYGISVFSEHHHDQHPHDKPRSVGDIISACRLLVEDPNFRSHMDGSHGPYAGGYGSTAVRSVASHLFHPNQTSYSPVQGVASHLFPSPQQSPYNPSQGGSSYPYNPPQQAPNNASQGVLSRLFGSPQQAPNNPGQGPASNLFSGQQQHFTASPFGNSFSQYPGY